MTTAAVFSLMLATQAFAHGEEGEAAEPVGQQVEEQEHVDRDSQQVEEQEHVDEVPHEETVRVVMAGEELEGDDKSVKIDGEVFVPLKFVAEKIGVEFTYKTPREIALTKEGFVSSVSTSATNDTNMKVLFNSIDVTPEKLMIREGRSLVSIDYVEKLFNLEVHNADYTNTYFIDINEFPVKSKDRSNLAFFPNGQGNTVSIVNYETGDVLDVISAELIPGAVNSHGIVVNNDGSKIYVSSMNSTEVSVYDLEKNQLEATIDVGFNTHHMDIDPKGKYIYVTELKGSKVAVIDAKSNKLKGTIVSGKAAYLPTASPDGKTLYVANMGENTISFIDVKSMEVTKKVHVGEKPSHIAVDAETGKIIVTNSADESISVISPEGKSVLTIKVGEQPHGVTAIDGKIYVANAGSNNVTMINLKTLTVVSNNIGADPGHIKASPDGNSVLVQVEGEQQLLVLDADTLAVKNKIELLSDGHQIVIPN